MFAVGQRVIHPGQGLCTVVGVKDGSTPMLVLETGSGRGTTRLLYPTVQAERNLHAPVSRERALEVIDGYDDITCDAFSDHNSGIEEAHFKALVKRGVPDSVCVVKTMRRRIAEAERRSKKPSTYLVRVLREARRRSLEELACALDTTPDEVAGMFAERGHDMAADE